MTKDIYKDKDYTPMKLTEEEIPFDSPDYIFEIKFDGIRALIYAEPGKITIKNRNGFILNNYYPELLTIKDIVKEKCIFDGEIILMVNGNSSFSKLQERALLKDKNKINYFKENYPVTFICYDILYEEKDITNFPLLKRKKTLEKYQDTDYFIKSPYILERGIELFNITKKHKLEGIIAKNKNSLYQIDKRSKDWIKIKNWQDEEFFVCGFIEKEKGSLASLILGERINNKMHYAGKVSIGKRNKEFIKIKEQKKLKRNYMAEFLSNGESITLIEPKLQCTVEFSEKTKAGKLRHPVFKGLRLD